MAHRIYLDYVLAEDGSVSLSLFRQEPEHREFTRRDKIFFSSRDKTVETHSGTYGLVSTYTLHTDFGTTRHSIYEENYEGDVSYRVPARMLKGGERRKKKYG